jgi:homoserine dehydrogenase
MSTIQVAILGFGTVGKGVYETVQSHQERLQFFLGKPVKVTAVLVKNIEKHQFEADDILLTDQFEDINLKNIDIVVEAMVGTEPGFTYLKRSVEEGCHIVTANKEMFAHHGQELISLAKDYGVSVGFEATVGGGIPVIQTLRKLLNINEVTRVEGIINGTSNFILSSMREEGLAFSETLKIAQEKGYAESDPTNDIEGFDAYYKALVLSHVVFGELPEEQNITRKGITSITQEQIQSAASLGLRFKHVVELEKGANGIQCSVQPVLVSVTHPFYGIEGVQNAVSIDANIVGNITLAGPGAGKFPTASAVIEDMLHLYQEPEKTYYDKELNINATINEQVQWIVLNQSIDITQIPDSLEFSEHLDKQAILFVGKSSDIQKYVIDHPELSVYPIKGNYQVVKELIKA